MRKVYSLAITLFALFALVACDKSNGGGPKKLEPAKPIVLPAETKAKVGGDNAFALDLFKAMCAAETGNMFISPLSVSMALNMTLNGADGETKQQMLEALRAGGYTIDQINEYSKVLREALIAVDPSTQIAIANSIWYRKGFIVKTPFIAVNQSYYNAEVKSLDFSAASAPTTINNWCKTQTNGCIDKIIEQISGDVMMCLINAVYFKGIWVSQFDKSLTAKALFTKADGGTQQVDMMRQTADFNYAADTDFACLEMPYGNGAFSMLVMLPNVGKTTDDVLSKLDNEYWNALPDRMHSSEVALSLPRLKTECKFTLNDVLIGMGMEVPFDKNNADFSGICTITPDSRLFISQVLHKTFLEIDEEGTEAAAVTAVVMEATTSVPQSVEFTVDRPFLLAIREKSTGVILFIGRIDQIL